MANSYYNHGSVPATGAPGSSATMRAEFDAITSGFALLPTLSGFGNKAIVVNAGGTALTTTAGSLSLAGNLTLAGAFTTSGAYDLTATLTAATNVTFPTTGTLATLAGAETLTNKTIGSPVLSGSVTGTYTLAGTPTITAPAISSPVLSGSVTGTYTLAGTSTITAPAISSPVLSGSVTGTYTLAGTPTITSPTLAGTPVFPDNVFTVSGSVDATKKLAFEVDGFTTATTRTLTVQDKSGTLALTSEFDYAVLAGSSGRMPFPAMWMQGLTYANNGVDAVNDLDIAAGQCRDATNAHNLILSALTKQSDVAWAVGTNQGALDTGVVGNSDYYIWAIKRSDTGVSDALFSLSSTAPTMPANYDYKRLIGWFKRSAGAILAFSTSELEGGGLYYQWAAVASDILLTNTLTTTRRTDALSVPRNFSVLAHITVSMTDVQTFLARVCSPSETDGVPGGNSFPLANLALQSQPGGSYTVADLLVKTSATGTIAARATDTVDSYYVATEGFQWARRN